MSEVRVVVDGERCAGHGLCYAAFPELFAEDEYGHSVVRDARSAAPERADARRAADNCPEAAIRIEPA